ncbi:MAG: ATP-dependent helicase [Thermosulfidibacteraceae bacterium]|jgi:DNA helicase-2/ATP-dependent DNA helicase PcrA
MNVEVIDSLLSTLTPSQREAVESIDGPVAVIAGPGSGKTRVVTVRGAYIATKGIPLRSILALTFTNRAANEMKERVCDILDRCGFTFDRSEILFSTFHSFSLWLLRRFADRIGYRNDFSIVDENDQKAIINEILKGTGIDSKFSVKRLVEIFSAIRCNINDYYEIEYSNLPCDEELYEIFESYRSYLFKHSLMDFDDLLLNTLMLFRDHPSILNWVRNRFKYVMVDEYQDTNRVQYYIVKNIAEEHRNICVVGDEDQSIYSWRNADIRNIMDFEKDFPDAKVIFLKENFRSTPFIISVANAVISKNSMRRWKVIESVKTGGSKVKLYEAIDERDEARFVVSKIKELKRPYRDYAIFYRTNYQSRVFEEELIRERIPYVLVGAFRFYERKEVKDVISYVRFILNLDDLFSLKRIINVPNRGIGEATFRLIMERIEQGMDVMSALKSLLSSPLLTVTRKQGIKSFIELIEYMRERVNVFAPSEFIAELLERSGYKKMLEEDGTGEAYSRLENIKELLNVASEYDELEDGLRYMIDRITIATSVDNYRESDCVTLMTLHSAKGLEFPVVFIAGVEEGLIPHSLSEDSYEIEEERRLFYVGITRAKDELFISYCKRRSVYGKLKDSKPSRFIKDIPDKYLEFIKLEVPSKVNSKSTSKRDSDDSGTIRRGDIVEHPIFGLGSVIDIYGSGDSAKALIRFEKVGVKLIALSFANLRKL